MTLADAWRVIGVADTVAWSHGWVIVSMLIPPVVYIWLGRRRPFALRTVELTEADVSACASMTALRELIVQRVTEACSRA